MRARIARATERMRLRPRLFLNALSVRVGFKPRPADVRVGGCAARVRSKMALPGLFRACLGGYTFGRSCR